MNIKTTLLVIIIFILIGGIMYLGPKFLSNNKNALTSPSLNTLTQKSTPTSTPLSTPNPPTINQNSNLKDEINKIKIPDFTEDIKNLKTQLN